MNKYSYDQLVNHVPECTRKTLAHLYGGKTVTQSAEEQGIHLRTAQKHVQRIATTIRELGESDAVAGNVTQYLVKADALSADASAAQLPGQSSVEQGAQQPVAATG